MSTSDQEVVCCVGQRSQHRLEHTDECPGHPAYIAVGYQEVVLQCFLQWRTQALSCRTGCHQHLVATSTAVRSILNTSGVLASPHTVDSKNSWLP